MSFRPRHRFARVAMIGVASLALMLGSAPATFAAQHSKRTPRRATANPALAAPATAAAPATVRPGSFGLMAFLDPETGLLTGPISSLMPPADQRAASVNVLLEEVPLPGGGWMIDLKGTGMESYVLQIDPLGNRTVSCVHDTRSTTVPPALPAAPGLPVTAARKVR